MTDQSPSGYLVYVQGMKGPCPTKWIASPEDWRGKPPPILAEHPLSADEYQLSLDELVKRYPAPEASQ